MTDNNNISISDMKDTITNRILPNFIELAVKGKIDISELDAIKESVSIAGDSLYRIGKVENRILADPMSSYLQLKDVSQIITRLTTLCDIISKR